MSLEPELLEMMASTVTVAPFASGTAAGSSSYGTGKTWRCRIQEENRLVRDREGREVVSGTQLFMAPTSVDGSLTSISINDQITLPAGYLPSAPPIIRVGRELDEDGAVHHWEISL